MVLVTVTQYLLLTAFIEELIDDPATQEHWKDIFMFDPMGMYSHPPTIAACKANLDIPELANATGGFDDLAIDGLIVREDKQVRTQKVAISYAWNLPRLSERRASRLGTKQNRNITVIMRSRSILNLHF